MLLCNLLLGFGLDAYVCSVSTKNKSAAHSWVLTLGTEGEATFWESLTEHRYWGTARIRWFLPFSLDRKVRGERGILPSGDDAVAVF